MKTIVIDIISVGNETHVPTQRGGYHKLEVAYKDNGKVMGKNLVDFTNPDLYKFVKGLKQGDHVVVDIEKEQGSDGREYWQWKTAAIGKTEEMPPVQEHSSATSTISPVVSAGKGKVLGSNYETPEERALRRAFEEKKQVLIIGQWSVSAAIEYLKAANGAIESIKDVLDAAAIFQSFVFNGPNNAKESKEAQRASTNANVEKSGASGSQTMAVSGSSIVSGKGEIVSKKRGRPAKFKEEPVLVDTFSDIPF